MGPSLAVRPLDCRDLKEVYNSSSSRKPRALSLYISCLALCFPFGEFPLECPWNSPATVTWSLCEYMCARMLSCVWLFLSPPGSSVHGISQARILGNSFPSLSYLRDPGIEPTHDSCVGRGILYQWATWEAGPGLYSVTLIPWRKFYDVESQVVRIEMSSPFLASSISLRRTSGDPLQV